MKERITHMITLLTMALIIAAMPVFTFAASGSGSHVKIILFAGIAIAFVIDMWHESKRGRRK